MTESSFIAATVDTTNAFAINPEAHNSLQLLHRCSSDDEDDQDDDVEEQEDADMTLSNNVITNDSQDRRTPELALAPSESWSTYKNRLAQRLTSLNIDPTFTTSGRGFCASNRSNIEIPTSGMLQKKSIQRSITYEPPRTTTSTPNGHHLPSPPSKSVPTIRLDETIDFSCRVSQTAVVFNDENGSTAAIDAFQNCHIPYEPTRNYADIWSFCLFSRKFRFYPLDERSTINVDIDSLPKITLSPCNLLRNRKSFWLAFDRRPDFLDEQFNVKLESIDVDSPPITNNTVLYRPIIMHSVHANVSYGALTSMNEYYYHPSYEYCKRSEWLIQFRPQKIELDMEIKRSNNKNTPKTFTRLTLPAELIDRTAIFTLEKLGFSVCIFIKGNIHESVRTNKSSYGQKEYHRPERKPSNDPDCPVFSTLYLRFCVKNFSSKQDVSEPDKVAALDQVKCLFKYLLDFFYGNQISVCFGSIENRRGCLINMHSFSNSFSTPIQIYAFTMLRNVGYLLEQKISMEKNFLPHLLDLAASGSESDDKFYGLCLYLFRRSTEYHFLRLEEELIKGNKEYENRMEQCRLLGEEMATILSPPRSNYAYVPSICVTPTTTQVRALKLVRLHRVIRNSPLSGPMSFALVEIRDEANRPLYAQDFRALRSKFTKLLEHGIKIGKVCYRYLHHSMSQVKDKQFWFMDDRHKLDDVLTWMGNFDNERVVAKHASRIALCFTSTEPSIQIPAELVKYEPDIKTEDKKYCFTDGAGTMSTALCKQVQQAMGKKFVSSVLQIRYGGCKGTISENPRLNGEPYQMVIRESMLKFTSEHDQLEICKVSSPRQLFLNRQAILLMSSRGIPDSHFLILQNQNHLWLVQALLCSSVGYELLHEKVGPNYFRLRDIANTLNLVEESFFLQLLVTCGHNSVSKLQQRAKIRVAKNKARNMFGIVDEYDVLEYGEVFIQYNHMNDEKLDAADRLPTLPPTILSDVQVVITKNPCHHPGDLRTFVAVDRPELRHLVDVVVFPRKGPRPHSTEMSGSDLDGDEYVVIWDSNLIPSTPNDEPYDYDSQEKPPELDHPVERRDIIDVVLDIATQNLTGDMSNIHLALADRFDMRHPEVTNLAGLISQELDAPKTGKHPIGSEELKRYRHDLLEDRYPDFMMKEKFKSYPSAKILGQLYRSARRSIIRWSKAARTHCSLRHLQMALMEDNTNERTDLSSTSVVCRQRSYKSQQEPSIVLDPDFDHPQKEKQIFWASRLFRNYKSGLLNIIRIFDYQDEIDLFCRCETLEQVALGKQDLNISATLELQRLIDTTFRTFFHSFDQLIEDPTKQPPHSGSCSRDRKCPECNEIKLARAAACYHVCYSRAAQESVKARSRILSFPWLFSSFLCKLKRDKQNGIANPSKYVVVGRAMRNAAKRLIDGRLLKLKILWPVYSDTAYLFLRSIKSTISNHINTELRFKRETIQPDQPTKPLCPSKILFIEIMHAWITRQNIFGEELIVIDKKPLVREQSWHQLLVHFISMSNEEMLNDNALDFLPQFELCKVVFQQSNNRTMTERYMEYINGELSISSSLSSDFDSSMYIYSVCLVRLCFRLAREQKSNEFAQLSDYLILALQSIAIEKELNDIVFDVSN